MNFCRLCDAEYPSDFDRCTICGAELVSSAFPGRPLHQKERDESLDMVWKSGDPVAVSEAIAALREAGIPHHVKATQDHFVFELGMPRPKYEVRVFRSDARQACGLLEPIHQSLPFAVEEHAQEDVHGPEEAEKMEMRRAARWNSAQATVEIWSGVDGGFARILEDCLRENHIGIRREGSEPGVLRILVMAEDAEAAREILREIREGVPPS